MFAEVHRVLRPGAGSPIYEQVRTGEGDLTYPLPWAEDERSSFVETVADYRAHLEAAGFEVEDEEDRTLHHSRAAAPGTGQQCRRLRAGRSSNASPTTWPRRRRVSSVPGCSWPVPDPCTP